MQGFEAIGLSEGANILREASRRIGGAARDRALRQDQLERSHAEFSDLDERFYAIEHGGALDRKMLEHARRHRSDFYFRGKVERAVFDK